MIHDLEDSDIGQWEGPGIPMDDVEAVKKPQGKKAGGYDLWSDLSSLKADITFGQLLEISPAARKTLKEGMPVNRRVRKAKTRIAARVQSQGLMREVKAAEIDIVIGDKVVPKVLVDGGSGLNIMPEHTLKQLGIQLTGPSPIIINMANQTSSVPLGVVEECRIHTGGEEYLVTFHVIKMHSTKDTFPILLGRPWLRMADAVVDWGGTKPSITYGPKGNRVKVSIGSLGGWVRQELDHSSGEEDGDQDEKNPEEILVGTMKKENDRTNMQPVSRSWGPSFYNSEDHGEYVRWLREYPESNCDVLMISQHLATTRQLGLKREENHSSLKEGEVIVRGICKFPDGYEDDSEDDSMHAGGTQKEQVSIENIEREKATQFIGMPRLVRKEGCVKDYAQLGSYVQIEAKKKLYEGDYNDGRVSASRGVTEDNDGRSQFEARQCWNEIQALWDEKGRSCLKHKTTGSDTSGDEEEQPRPSAPRKNLPRLRSSVKWGLRSHNK